jgi:hypothetical protein
VRMSIKGRSGTARTTRPFRRTGKSAHRRDSQRTI